VPPKVSRLGGKAKMLSKTRRGGLSAAGRWFDDEL